MNHTECKDCKLREGDCGYHHRIDGVVNLDIPSLSSCDKYGNCGHFQQEETPKGDLIRREALKKAINDFYDEFFDGCFSTALITYSKGVDEIIDNAPTVDVIPNEEGYEMYGKGYCKGYLQGYGSGKNERPKGECETCTYRIFTEKFADSISEVMAQYGITSIEELQARLQEEMRGKEE